MSLPTTPKGWAIRLTQILSMVQGTHGLPRFPIDVAALAQDFSRQVFPDAPITIVQGLALDVIKNRTTEDDCGGDQAPVRLPAGMVEDAIVTEVRRILQTPEVVTQVLAALKRDQVSEAEAIAALHDFNTLWAQLFPLEQARIIQLLVRRVTVTAAGLEIDIRREGVAGVIREMIAPRDMEAAE